MRLLEVSCLQLGPKGGLYRCSYDVGTYYLTITQYMGMTCFCGGDRYSRATFEATDSAAEQRALFKETIDEALKLELGQTRWTDCRFDDLMSEV